MPGRLRTLIPVLTTAVAVPAVGILAAGVIGVRGVDERAVVTAPLTYPEAPPKAEQFAIRVADVSTPSLGTLAAIRYLPRSLPPGVGEEKGLQVKTILAERMISARFPEVDHIGGCRPDALPWHPAGLAIDVGIPDYETPAGKALGDRIVAYAFQNAARWGLVHVIWQQTYMPADGPAHRMSDLGSPDANHYTHVHIATQGGGYPTGTESYIG